MSIKMNICTCCDESVADLVKRIGYKLVGHRVVSGMILYDIYELNLEQVIRSDIEGVIRNDLQNCPVAPEDVDGIIDICFHPYGELNDSGERLIQKCIDHLNQRDDRHETLWDFVTEKLGFEVNGGYDYLLMTYLDTHDIIEHGSGIRCAWLSSEYIVKDNEVTQETK